MDPVNNLERFLEAQSRDYTQALSEIKKGRKQSHWIWYIFPQISGLGFSSTSVFYAIKNLEEAADYLHHPVLGSRLIETAKAILEIEDKTANQILGNPDDVKLKSCMTLFSLVKNTDPVFQAVLDKYFNGKQDFKTIEIVLKMKSA
ncbi:DUF1810 domain-containing protein [Dyadobacter sp. NIV53]|uniref:DUF1810 domain-containing protein n=1 Tax=Dyadobacter sp. NIV53 TaxID=2861765 RepID=UPI001C88D971|nr:DUF1810 domain-containing protein [Dyadobacter sp. NIV53]